MPELNAECLGRQKARGSPSENQMMTQAQHRFLCLIKFSSYPASDNVYSAPHGPGAGQGNISLQLPHCAGLPNVPNRFCCEIGFFLVNKIGYLCTC